MAKYDIAIIGAGIIGLATAKQITERTNFSVVVMDSKESVATGQTGHNSGVIHSGLYYRPGSLKARTCTEGRKAMYGFCDQYGIKYERCGKIVVATGESDLERLLELERRGYENGLMDIRRLDAAQLKEYEPNVQGIAGLLVQETGIVDYVEVAKTLASVVQDSGHSEMLLGYEVRACHGSPGHFTLETPRGDVQSRFIVNCAGLYSDRVAGICGAKTDVRIVPFRGEYYRLRSLGRKLVMGLIYPVPNPDFPFLGVHFTRRVDGMIEAGPNAVLALKREGYWKRSFSIRDAGEVILNGAFWKLAQRYWRTGLVDLLGSYSKKLFTKALQRMVPEIHESDLEPGGSGVRAQALDANGRLVDDFRFVEQPNILHVVNAPSPGATASIRIGEIIAERILSQM